MRVLIQLRAHCHQDKSLLAHASDRSAAVTAATTRWPKKVSCCQIIKNSIKSYESLSMRLDLFVKLKYQSITTILSVGIKYSIRDLLCDLDNSPGPQNSNMRYIP